MRNLYLVQVNYKYGNNVFLPYSVGRLWATAKQSKLIRDNYKFKEFIFLREDIDKVIERMDNPDIVAISCYIWNWNYSINLADKIAVAYPDCLIVFGGPQIPDDPLQVLIQYPDCLIVHGEGENTFTEILKHRCTDNDYSNIDPVSQIIDRDIKIGVPARTSNLDNLPSPYLEGVFDELMKLQYNWQANQETHRGCPYQCTFCDWGSATFQKVRKFSDDRIIEEIAWFAKNKIELLYNCDANYGMMKRDVLVSKALAAAKQEYGYPKKFRAAWAKKSSQTVFESAKILNDADMQKGVTISLQSLDDGVLENVKRKNIAIDDLPTLISQYKNMGIPTYTELILGLPGESYSTFVKGICQVLEAGQDDGINIYPCILLKNAEMSNEETIEEFDIQSVYLPMLLLHGSPAKNDVNEYYELVISTKHMSHENWKMAYEFGWVIQAFHCLPVLQHIVNSIRELEYLSYYAFYCSFLEYFSNSPNTIIGKEIIRTRELLIKVLEGKPWDTTISECGDITWPPEEATFIRLMQEDLDSLYDEISDFIYELKNRGCIKSPNVILNSFIDRQRFMVSNPNQMTRVIRCAHDKSIIQFNKEYKGDVEAWARECVWYGRKGGKSLLGKVLPVEQ